MLENAIVPVISAALGIVAYGIASWLDNHGKAARLRAQARLQEAKNAARDGGPHVQS